MHLFMRPIQVQIVPNCPEIGHLKKEDKFLCLRVAVHKYFLQALQINQCAYHAPTYFSGQGPFYFEARPMTVHSPLTTTKQDRDRPRSRIQNLHRPWSFCLLQKGGKMTAISQDLEPLVTIQKAIDVNTIYLFPDGRKVDA